MKNNFFNINGIFGQYFITLKATKYCKRMAVDHFLCVTIKNGDEGNVKQVIGKSIVSTLAPGSELNLTTGSLLERATGMHILSDRCTPITP